MTAAAARRTRRMRPAIAIIALIVTAISAPGLADNSRKAAAHGPGGRRVAARNAPEPRMFNLKHGTGEPTLGLTKSGTVFVTSSDGCVTSCAGSTEAISTVAPGGRVVFASPDKGKTWEDRTPGVGALSPHVLSMDPYIYVDQRTSRIFNIDLTVACAILSLSDNEGLSWITNPLACGEPVNDHQTLFAGPPATSTTIGYPNVVYYCFNHPAVTKCNKSINGGLSFMTTTDLTGPTCGGLNGHGITDAEGVVFIPLGSCGRPTLGISRDEGNTWTTVEVADLPSDSGGDPSVAIDENGTLYYLFVSSEDRLPYLVTSRDGGESWSTPIMVAPAGVKATNLATLQVGKPGNVALAYYGTTSDEADRWNGYLAEGFGILGRSPVFYTATVNDPREPFKAGACGPGRCGRVLDFIDVEIAPDGHPWAAYVDACAKECEETGTESIADNEGVIGTLVGGTRLK